MTLAMIKFLRVVSHQNINIWLIVIQIFGLAFWTLARLAAGAILIVYVHDYQEYLMDKDILVCGIFGFFGDVLHFFIIAYVIYKSSIVAGNHGHDKEQKRVTLLSKLQDQHKEIYDQLKDNNARESLEFVEEDRYMDDGVESM